MNIRQEAWDIIVKVLKNNMFSDKLLAQSAKKLHKANENPELLYHLVKGVIKMQLLLEHIAYQYTDKSKFKNTDIKIKVLIYLALYQIIFCKSIPEHAAVNETVELANKKLNDQVAGFVNAVLRAYLRNPQYKLPEDTAERISIEHSFPLEIIKQWLSRWDEEQVEYLAMYYNESPKLYLRVNTLATQKEKLIKYFEKKSIKVSQTPASKNMLISDDAKAILNDVSYDEGYFTIQDISAALVIELLNPQFDNSILDLFAGRGGKASYIAELMQNTGEIIAVDKIPHKIKEMKQTLTRIQANNVKLITEDAFKFGPVAPMYDGVLLDVPCSGWGVFQKKAELRWQEKQNIPELIKLQEKALLTGAQFVKPGGFLVYSTCTINPLENEAQIEKFLNSNPNFKLIPAETLIPKEYTESGYLKTIPNIHHMDGAFAAKLMKKLD
jgi:16S rRNA (cytosine967-C5)-methyltransferase